MKGDLSRRTRDLGQNYTGVLHQQGRVLLDQDWNAASTIEGDLRETMSRDAIGEDAVAVPSSVADSLKVLDANSNGNDVTVKLNTGRCWVNGLHLQVTPYPGQIDVVASYFDSTNTPADIANGDRDAVILELWEESISAYQLPEQLLEPALGGPDTTLRKKVCWALRLLRLNEGEECFNLKDRLASKPASPGKLTVAPSPTFNIVGDCPVQASGGYTGFEHYLYRIEIASPGSGGLPRFKWSRFNGGLVGRGTYDSVEKKVSIVGNAQAINQCGLDRFYLEALVPDECGSWKVVCAGEAIQEADGILSLALEPGVSFPTGSVFFRLWDGIQPIANYLATSGTEFVPGLGVELAFSSGNSEDYLEGDYWDFPVRGAGIENDLTQWPTNALPEGVRYQRAPLGIIKWQNSGANPTSTRESDCRKVFRPLTRQEGCCTFTVGDGKHSYGDFGSIREALLHLPMTGGKICVLPGVHEANARIIRDGVSIQGCGDRSVVKSAKGRDYPVFHIHGSSRCRIDSLVIHASSESSGIFVETSGDFENPGAVVEPKNISLTNLTIFASADSAIKVRTATGLTIANCKITMLNVASEWPGIFVQANDASLEHNTVTVSKDRLDDGLGWDEINRSVLSGRGGIQIGGGSQQIDLIHNRIIGGIGNGITLGSLYGENQEAKKFWNFGWVLSIGNPCDPCADGGTRVRNPNPDNEDGMTWHSVGTLYDVRIERNQIHGMGLNGIGVVGFFDLKEQDEFISVSDLKILGNDIQNCLSRSIESVPTEMEGSVGYGAIALADVESLVIHDNVLMNNGESHLDPICGVFVLHGEGVDIQRNRILNNGKRSGVGTDGAKSGDRAGIRINYAIAPTTSIMVEVVRGNSYVLPRQNGVPALRIHDNIVAQPMGHALYARALGPVSVVGNQLTSQGTDADFGTDYYLAATINIFNLGLSDEMYQQVGFAAASMVSSKYSNLKKGKESVTLVGLDDFSMGKFLSNGNIMFANNQVVTDYLAVGNTLAMSAIGIFTLDDLAFQGNQIDCALGYTGPRRTEDFIFFDAFLFGLSIRVNSNRFKESLHGCLLSGLTIGMINHTVDNQSTHCLVASAFGTTSFKVERDNVVLTELQNPGDDDTCSMFRIWTEAYEMQTRGKRK